MFETERKLRSAIVLFANLGHKVYKKRNCIVHNLSVLFLFTGHCHLLLVH